MRNAQPKKSSTGRRPRFLILSYDSAPNQELLWPLADAISEHADCLFLVQFPKTLHKLRKRGFYARSIRSILGWEHGVQPGRSQRLESPLMDLSDTIEYERKAFPSVPEEIFLEQANVITHRFKDLIESFQPSFILAWNGHTLPYKPCLAYARQRGIALRFLERGFFPKSLFLDTEGTNSASAVKNNFNRPFVGSEEDTRHLMQRLLDNYSPIVTQNGANKSGSESLRSQLGVEDDTFLFLVPEQLENDSNTVLFCHKVKSNRLVLEKVSEAIDVLGYTDVRVLYKTHPELEVPSRLDDSDRLKHTQVTDHISIESLLRGCDAVITRNSTVGFEGLLFGKRCITLGDSIYSGLGITDDVKTLKQLPEVMSRVYESVAIPDIQASNLGKLVSRLHQEHHYFVEPGCDEKEINEALVNMLLAQARSSVCDGFLKDEPWNDIPWRVHAEEAIWGLRLRYREIKKLFVKGLKSR